MSQQTPNEFSPSPKQIIFLFMAATVVAVVVFLFGLLVGRGVPLEGAVAGQGLLSNTANFSYVDERPATILERQSAEPSAAVLTGDEFSYSDRLQQDQPSVDDDLLGITDSEERLGLEAPRPMPDSDEEDTDPDMLALVEPVSENTPTDSSVNEDINHSNQDSSIVEGDEFTVQVMSLQDRAAAERVASGLVEKGYDAFGAPPVEGAPARLFRVRVGRYSDREEAERIKNRLEQNERLKPWITH